MTAQCTKSWLAAGASLALLLLAGPVAAQIETDPEVPNFERERTAASERAGADEVDSLATSEPTEVNPRAATEGEPVAQQSVEERAAAEGLDAAGEIDPPASLDPFALGDDTWISIVGTVATVSRDSFVLDFGDGEITVEMDDGDRDADAYQLLAGDRVIVNGEIDAGLFERTTIEAGSVYVEKLGTYFYASTLDEEEMNIFHHVGPVAPATATLIGTVTEVDDDEFTLNTGERSVTVEVEDMENSPLDDEGYQRIRPGDVVSVGGSVDYDFLEGREIKANAINTLWRHPG